MRRMLTNKNVVDIVNQGIESGDITVEGGLPEIEAGDAGKVLAVNSGETGTEWITPEAGGGAFELTGAGTLIAGKDHLAPASSVYPMLLVDYYSGTRTGTYSNSNVNGSIIVSKVRWKNLGTNQNSLILSPDTAPTNPRQVYNSLLVGFGESEWGNYQWRGVVKTGSFYFSNKYVSVDASLILGDGNSWLVSNMTATSSNVGTVNGILTLGTNPNINITNGGYQQIRNSIFMCGLQSQSDLKSQIQISNSSTASIIEGVSMFGVGHNLTYTTRDASQGVTICGRFGNGDASTERFIVGAGTSASARANCFVAGNDGTDDYIKVGDTKLTEAQLQALLATL